jgi:hypothetical protein
MTVPEERTRAVVETRKFLQALAAGRMSRQSPELLQEYGRMLLRHYPSTADMHLTSEAFPAWWAPPAEHRK